LFSFIELVFDLLAAVFRYCGSYRGNLVISGFCGTFCGLKPTD
jgi:hypothetical protein